MIFPRRLPRPLSTFAALTLLAACPSVEADDGSNTEACLDPGTPLLPDAKPAPIPRSSKVSCTSGWGTDAPQRDAAWTIQVTEESSDFLFHSPIVLGAHPDGGVVMAASAVFARFDRDGDQLWAVDDIPSVNAQVVLLVEPAGTIVLSTYDLNTEETTVVHYDADGELLETVAIPWNSPDSNWSGKTNIWGGQANVWGLASFGTDLVIAGVDADMSGSHVPTLIRLDPAGDVVSRMSSGLAEGQVLAVNDNGTAIFGGSPGVLVSLEDGEVLGDLTQSTGFPNMAVARGEDFFMAGAAAGDLSIGRYSSAGAERWLETYDRASLDDQGNGVAVAGEQLVIVGSTSLLDFNNSSWTAWGFSSWFVIQPIVLAIDVDGEVLWSDRISAHGDATAVAIGNEGEVYVAGSAERVVPPNELGSSPVMQWLRRYDL